MGVGEPGREPQPRPIRRMACWNRARGCNGRASRGTRQISATGIGSLRSGVGSRAGVAARQTQHTDLRYQAANSVLERTNKHRRRVSVPRRIADLYVFVSTTSAQLRTPTSLTRRRDVLGCLYQGHRRSSWAPKRSGFPGWLPADPATWQDLPGKLSTNSPPIDTETGPDLHGR